VAVLYPAQLDSFAQVLTVCERFGSQMTAHDRQYVVLDRLDRLDGQNDHISQSPETLQGRLNTVDDEDDIGVSTRSTSTPVAVDKLACKRVHTVIVISGIVSI